MNWFSGFIRKQGQFMLTYDMYALFNTVILVVLPYTGWLAASILALVTLRKGMKAGSLLLVPALIASFIVLKTTLPTEAAIVGSILSYVPCYLAACVLGVTRSFRLVSVMLSMMVLVAMCVLHAWFPEFIMQQYQYLREVLNQLQIGNSFPMLGQSATLPEQTLFANYLLGIQAAGVVLSTLISLVLARFVQSRIFYPEGFKQEMCNLRCMRVDLLLFLLILFAVKQHDVLAINMLPIFLLFFFIAGVSLWFDSLAVRGLFVPMLVVSIVLGFFPQVMLPVFVVLGALDTLFNFRLYLHNRAGKAIGEVK